MKHSFLLSILILALLISVVYSEDTTSTTTIEFNSLQTEHVPSPTYGMVNADGLRIRDKPEVNGVILGKLLLGDIVNVLDEQGTNTIQNGIWDYWYRISNAGEKEQWINALYVSKGPIEAKFSTQKAHYYDNFQSIATGTINQADVVTYVPLQLTKQSKQRYRSSVSGILDYYYEIKSFSYFVEAVNNKIVHGSELNFIIGALYRQIDITDFPIFRKTPETQTELIKTYGTPISEKKQEFKHPSSDKVYAYIHTYVYKNITIEFIKNINEEKIECIGLTISDDTVPVKYGLRIGSTSSDVTEILGKSKDGTKDSLVYKHDYEATGYQIEFQCKNSKIIGIKWETYFYL